MRLPTKFIFIWILFCFSNIPLLYAEQLGSPLEEDILSGEELLFQDIGSVFSASKFEQKITKAPSKISIVTAEEIKQYGYRTIEDILKSLPGFYTANDRQYSYTGVRGFSTPGDYDTKILMLVDGHRLNDNVYDSFFTDHGFIVDLDLVERIEVIRGPGSALYGSNAFFGVINVITKNGRALEGVELSGSIGSHDTYQGRVSFGKRFTNGMELLLSGTYYDSDGESSLYYPEFDDPETNYGIAQDSDDENVGNFFGKLMYKDFTLTGAWVDREKGIPTGSYETEFNDSRNRSFEGQAYVVLSYNTQLSDDIDLTASLSYNWYWYDGDYVYDYGPPPDLVVNKDSGDGEWWTAESFMTWDILENHRIVAGAEYSNSTKQTQKNYDVYGTYLDVESDIDNWGVFLQETYTVSESLSFNLGVRYDDYSDVDSSINPRAAAVYTPFDTTSFKLLYGTSFRTPNAYELFYEDDGISQKTNENLESETIQSYEFVAEHQFNSNIRTTASVFYNDIDDLIVLTEDPEDELLVFQNLGSAEVRGAEVDLNGSWKNGLNATLTYTYQDAEDDQGNWLVNSPEHMAKLNLTFPILNDLVSGGLEMQYMSERLTLGNNETDESFVTNLTFLSRNPFDIEGMTVSASVYNLFDEEYSYPVSDAHIQDSIEQKGITFGLKIDYLF